MGNRAVITLKTHKSDYRKQVGIYVHWVDGRASIEGFLAYCRIHGFRSPSTDNYGWARLTQVIANYFGGDGLSVGIDVCQNLDCNNYDNGVYFIKNWEIVGRDHFEGKEQNDYMLIDVVREIDKAQPVEMQLGEEKIKDLLSTKTEGTAARSAANQG